MLPRSTFLVCLLFAPLFAPLLAPTIARAQSVLRDDFESSDVALHPAGGDTRHRVELHQRATEGGHASRGCEQIRISGNNGTTVYYSYPIRAARVINEFSVSLWLKADRPGLQLAVRVVLPRSKHPTKGEPLTTLIRGGDYKQVGTWQLLKLADIAQSLKAQVRVLRSQFGSSVDEREAYVDLVLLNAYGGPGTTNLWVDDLEVTGIVAPANAPDVAPAEQDSFAQLPAAQDPTLPSSMPSVELRNRLTVGGKPFLPRIIEHQGEPLAPLQALGFNCVSVAKLPSPELLAEASRLGMWFIAPPPTAAQLLGRGAGGPRKISPAFDCVLAWNMGSFLTRSELDATRQWAEIVQNQDPRDRPILCHAQSELEAYTRPPFKILLARHDVLGTSLELSQFGAWLQERAQLARAGAPLWAVIQTQPHPRLAEQAAQVAGAPTSRPVGQEAQIRMLARAALVARARGLYFTSYSRLDAQDPATKLRAAQLEMVNMELELIERWPAAGTFGASATTSEPHTTGAVLASDQSRLLLPIYTPPGGQFTMGKQAPAQVAFRVPGVAEGDDAYEVALTGVRSLRSTRVSGGTQVILDELTRDSLVVFTADPAVLRNFKEGLQKTHRRAAQVARQLAEAELARLTQDEERLAQVGRSIPATQQARAKAAEDIKHSEALSASDVPKSYYQARHALQTIRQIERLHWEQATSGLTTPLISPLTTSFATLPDHYRVQTAIAAAPRGANQLTEGHCEDLRAMVSSGWKHYQHRQEGISASVELVASAAHEGLAGLVLKAAPADPKKMPAGVETPTVWITTAPIDLRAGDLVQIQAWIKIDKPLAMSVDGLVIIESLGGETLALRLQQTTGWQQVTLYRAAPRNGPLTVTFALAGLGEAAVDDVSVQVLQRGSAAAAGQQAFQPRLPAQPVSNTLSTPVANP